MLIGFSGRAGSGKDTAAAALGPGVTVIKFAGALKAMITTLLRYQGISEAVVQQMIEGALKETPSAALGGRTVRHATQTLGTEWGRERMHPDFWAGIARRMIEQALEVGQMVAVTDVRFPNEVDLIRELGGKVVRITRPSAEASVVTHISEELPPFDFEIRNDFATEDQFRAAIRYVILGNFD